MPVVGDGTVTASADEVDGGVVTDGSGEELTLEMICQLGAQKCDCDNACY